MNLTYHSKSPERLGFRHKLSVWNVHRVICQTHPWQDGNVRATLAPFTSMNSQRPFAIAIDTGGGAVENVCLPYIT